MSASCHDLICADPFFICILVVPPLTLSFCAHGKALPLCPFLVLWSPITLIFCLAANIKPFICQLILRDKAKRGRRDTNKDQLMTHNLVQSVPVLLFSQISASIVPDNTSSPGGLSTFPVNTSRSSVQRHARWNSPQCTDDR
jgi:hypothetical protein